MSYEDVVSSIAPQSADDENVPKSYSDAMDRIDLSSWLEAKKLKINFLEKLNTWELVPEPKDRRIIQAKWVYAQMKDIRRMVIRNKARPVAKGFTQIPGTNFAEVFQRILTYNKLCSMNSLSV